MCRHKSLENSNAEVSGGKSLLGVHRRRRLEKEKRQRPVEGTPMVIFRSSYVLKEF